MSNKANHINLFEFSNRVDFFENDTLDKIDELDIFLDNIWKKRERSVLNFWGEENNKDTGQKFIQFDRKNKTIRSNKYVGIIKYKDDVINLLPKIFYKEDEKRINEEQVTIIQSHILWWLSYCRKFKFPKSFSSFNNKRANFFEVLIYLYASYTKEILGKMIYQAYEEVENDLPFMKGHIDFNKYISQNYISGNKHKLSCIYDSFEMDNTFNRIIKFVSKLLFNYASEPDNKRQLREILFILDDVTDIKATIYDCERVKINPLFAEMNVVLDYCKLFLSNSTVLSYKNQFEVFAFLLPMEYIFEDFIFGFIKKELDVKVKSQVGNSKLTEEGVFTLRPDLVFEITKNDITKRIIADTKYKIIYPNDDSDKKHGISEGDMYQMLTYAVRNKVEEIKLFYPSTISAENNLLPVCFNIKDEFSGDAKINIIAYQLPIIANYDNKDSSFVSLEKSFGVLREILKDRIEDILSFG
ncbi:MAG: hypothetical protein RBT49_00795 [Bacteroidales bacterium]|jgi:5-methylcytosine-specific restriction enzyme subunit McrC|nr:hypothetical protein [Bacteroidales bacterium]